MKIIAWNVNGIRALNNKGILMEYLDKHQPDIFCMGETKLSLPDEKTKYELNEKNKEYKYRYYATSKERKGYSGTAIWSKIEPINVTYGIDGVENKTYSEEQKKILDNNEGRIITIEMEQFYIIHCYVPNSGQAELKNGPLSRLQYRINEWDKLFQMYLKMLQKKKPIIVCGDMNCAYTEIDIHNAKSNEKNAGFTIEERTSFGKYLDKLKLVDIFRDLNINKIAYTYWSYRGNARKNNKGWRIDYFLISNKLKKKVTSTTIHEEQLGSDHAPIEFTIDVN